MHQRHILSLDGPVVTASGYKDELVVVTHISPSLPTDEQVLLKYLVEDPLVENLISIVDEHLFFLFREK